MARRSGRRYVPGLDAGDDHRELLRAARDTRQVMTRIHDENLQLAHAMGRLMALLDNTDGTETLSSIRSDTGFQLMRAVADAYQELAGFLASIGGNGGQA